jgi:hypothetical protein
MISFGCKVVVDESILFEQVVAHLLKAEHGVVIECAYRNAHSKRQFDGYREEMLDDLETVIKIAIECKKWRSKVPRSVVEAFSRKIEGCGIKYGFIVSFSGFQRGAIEDARELDIGLFEFRPCTDADFKKGTKLVKYDLLLPNYLNSRLRFGIPAPLYEERKQIIEAMRDIYKVTIYDEKGNVVGNLGRIVTDIVEREMIQYGSNKGKTIVDWSDKNYQCRSTLYDKSIFATSIEVEYELPIREIRPLNPENYYMMKNVITGSRKLIALSKVKAIESKYL